MNSKPSQLGRQMIDGTVRVFLAEALFPITAVITAAFLTRRLGANGYGLLTLAATTITWIEWSLVSLFSRATIKFIREAEDWKPVGQAIVRAQFGISIGVMLAVFAAAGSMAQLMHEPKLAGYLRLLALDIPIFNLAFVHRGILIGLGGFRQRAVAGGVRWIARLVFIVILVEQGMHIHGALIGMIGASLVELAICRAYVRPPIWGRPSFRVREMMGYVAPLFVFALTSKVIERIDLFMLKGMGASAELAGIFGAAQNLALLPGLVSLSMAPLLLSTLSRLVAEEDPPGAKPMAEQALRGVIILVPITVMIAMAAPAVVDFIYGQDYAQASPLFAILMYGSMAKVIIAVATVTLTAAGKPSWCLAVSTPMLVVVVVAELIMIPRWQETGAALGSTAVSIAGAVGALVLVFRCWRVYPPFGTVVRTTVLVVVMCLVPWAWPKHGAWIMLEMSIGVVIVLLMYFLLGEFNPEERLFFRSLIRRGESTSPGPPNNS
jgi:O-antigen/teichoic acid export membrane protein